MGSPAGCSGDRLQEVRTAEEPEDQRALHWDDSSEGEAAELEEQKRLTSQP